MNDTDVQETNTDYKPELHENYKLVLKIWLDNNNVVPGKTKMLIQEHVALGKIRFCVTDWNTQDCGISKEAEDTSMLPSKFDQMKVSHETGGETNWIRMCLDPFLPWNAPKAAFFSFRMQLMSLRIHLLQL